MSAVRAKRKIAGVVDQDVDVSGAFGQRGHLGGVGQVGGLEADADAEGFDLLEDAGGTFPVAAVHDDVGAAALPARVRWRGRCPPWRR